jgi:hypothetical protein
VAGIELIRNVNDDLRSTVDDLERSLKEEQPEQPTQNKKELLLLAEQCRDVANELFAVLEPLKVYAKSKDIELKAESKSKDRWYKRTSSFPVEWYGWQNFRTALRTVWKEDQIKLLENKVDAFRQQLILRILVSFR